jgi:hypothetical protein
VLADLLDDAVLLEVREAGLLVGLDLVLDGVAELGDGVEAEALLGELVGELGRDGLLLDALEPCGTGVLGSRRPPSPEVVHSDVLAVSPFFMPMRALDELRRKSLRGKVDRAVGAGKFSESILLVLDVDRRRCRPLDATVLLDVLVGGVVAHELLDLLVDLGLGGSRAAC